MESSFKPLTSVEFYEGCLTSSERSFDFSFSPEPSLSPSSTAREYYEGCRTSSELSARTSSELSGMRTKMPTFVRTILLADRVAKVADDVIRSQYYKEECRELKANVFLAGRTLLWLAAHADIYGRPLSRIIDETEPVLQKAFTLVNKYRHAKNGIMKRVFTIIAAATFKKVTAHLENFIKDVSLPPIAILYTESIKTLIVNLYTESMATQTDDTNRVTEISLAQNELYAKRIIERAAQAIKVVLMRRRKDVDQEDAARAIGYLALDPESDEQMILARVGTVFAQILKQGHSMMLQSVVAWAISELASNHPKCQHHFAQNNIIHLLLNNLAFETVQEHSNLSREYYEDDPATKAEMKAMAARALWKLCEGNPRICHSIITDSRALLCFAVLLEKGPEQVQYNSTMVLMEIAAVTPWDTNIGNLAFEPRSPAFKAVVDRLLWIVEKADSDLLVIPCIEAIGSLSKKIVSQSKDLGDIVKQTLATLILLTDRVAKVAEDDFHLNYEECAKRAELKAKTEKLASLLRQAARGGSDLNDRPLSQIIDETEQTLFKALALVIKCSADFTIIPSADFKKVTAQLENSFGVLAVSANPRVEEVGLPPIPYIEPIRGKVWNHIANLYTGSSMETKAYAAASLVSLAENKRCTKHIQEDAARAIGIFARDPESVDQMILARVGTVFAQILEQGNSMKLQSVVAWAISELASSHPKCQHHFSQNNIIHLLLNNLAFETVQEHSKGREFYEDDPATKAEMKAMAARALWKLCKGNPRICYSVITDTRALLCFAVLLEKGPEQVQYNSAMVLMEIAAVAERDADFRRSAFKPNSPAAKTVVDQLLRIVLKADSDRLVIPCLNAIGSLAGKSFPSTEKRRIFGPLVRLLHEREGKVRREAVIVLSKFVCLDYYLRIDPSKAILNAQGVKRLVQFVYFGKQMVQTISLALLCYTALHEPDIEALAQAEVLTLLEWASKQGYMAQDPYLETLLPEAKGRLELMYQSRGSR